MSAVHATSRVRLRPLVIRPEDGEYVVGCMDNEQFVMLPEVGRRAVELFRLDLSVGEVHDAIEREFGFSVDLAEFVGELTSVGFVESVDNDPAANRPAAPAAVDAAPKSVSRTVVRLALAVYLAVVLAGVATLVLRPDSRPYGVKLLVVPWTSLVLVIGAVLFAAVIALHELAHLAAARALGLPARVSLGTRLYFLTAQTEVPCLWALPRRQRCAVYVAGMACDVLVLCLAVVGSQTVEPLSALLGTISVVVLINVATQLQLFMRTDLYFVAADLARTKNLFQDSSAYILHVLRALGDRIGRRPGPDRPHPLAALPVRERRVVRIYAAIMTVGTALSLAFFFSFLVPIIVSITIRAISSVSHGVTDGSIDHLANGLLTLSVQIAYYALFVRAWLRGRSERMQALRNRLG